MADPPEVRAEAEVRLWGETVGAVVELESGHIVFEYDDQFRRRGLEISPIHLPTDLAGPLSFSELRRRPAFEGLPGVLADALPDAFGNQVIRAYYAARNEAERAMSPVQRLLYVGERALGALTFHPPEALPVRAAEEESLEIAALVRDARRIIRGEPEVAIPEIYRIGSSAGGQRPKAIVHYDPKRGSIRSGDTPLEPGEVPCILKFDGVGGRDAPGELGPPQAYNRVEAAYAEMALAAGVEMSEIDVLQSGGYAHLLVRRFDLMEGTRLHQHTLGGLIHVDYNEPGASSYEEYPVNQDDHVKNLSFHMRPSGEWSLTPAYDVTFARGHGWTANHQMRVQDKMSGIRQADLLAVAELFDIKKPSRILEETRSALADWERFAARYEVPTEAVGSIRREFDARADVLAG